MNIALIGYGKMGQEVERAAQRKRHALVAKCDPAVSGAAQEIKADVLEGVDVCIDFTRPEAVLDNIRRIAALNKPIVVGTTGWYENLPAVESIIYQTGVGLVYAPNFSLGVSLFYRIVQSAASLFSHFDDYDVHLAETHHRYKVDSPSGTAKKLAELVLLGIPRKKRIVTESLNRSIQPDELHVLSARAGHFPGGHEVVFDSEADTVELRHTARSRAGFAAGALLAAQWVLERKGVYTLDQVLEDLLS